jgi:bacteriocin-like protein
MAHERGHGTALVPSRPPSISLMEKIMNTERELTINELDAVSGGTVGEPMGKTDVIKAMGNYQTPYETTMNVWHKLLGQYGF